MAGGAAVLIAVVVLGVVLSGRIWGHQPGVSATPGPQVTAPGVPTTAPTTVPATQPSLAPTALPGFGAGPVTGGSPGVGTVSIASVRAAAQAGFDRFVIDFGSSPPKNLAFEVLPQATSTFITDPKGEQVTLQGTRGVEVNLFSVSNWTSLPGSTDLHLGLPAIKEARRTGDFEANVHWSLGIDGPGFVRLMTLTGPTRLVVDVQS
jgi:hypothetical protein